MDEIRPAPFWRPVVVVVLSLLVLAVDLPDLSLDWQPFYDFGMRFDAAGNVVSVYPGGPADEAGIDLGDHVDVANTPLASRVYLFTGFNAAKPGERRTFTVSDGDEFRHVTLTARVRPRGFLDNLSNTLLQISIVAFIAIAATLAILRPSAMTWAFFLYAIFANTAQVVVPSLLPLPGTIAFQLIFDPWGAVAWVALLSFALLFPTNTRTGWRGRAQAYVLPVGFLVYLLALYQTAAPIFALPFVAAVVTIIDLLDVVGLLVVGTAFVLTYRSSAPAARARIRWVMLGLLVGYGGTLTFQLFSSLPGIAIGEPIWLVNVQLTLQLAVPLTVAYACIRHRIFDVRVVVSRALVYGLLTTALVVVITLIDFIVGRLLVETRIAVIGEVVASVAIGLSLNTVHKVLEQFVDRTLYRSRNRAQHRLQRVGNGLLYATSPSAVTTLVTQEPLDAFRLASASVFRESDDGSYQRVAALGWDDATVVRLEADDPIVLQLRAEVEPLRIRDTRKRDGFPSGAHGPAIALPIVVRGRLRGIAFYGAHTSGEELDTEEVESLQRLLEAAGVAYDHLEAQIALGRMKQLEEELRSARSALPSTPVLRSALPG